jgi:hypothetical protein
MFAASDPFVVGSDILDMGTRKAELRGRRNRMTPDDMSFGMPTQMPIPQVANVSLVVVVLFLCCW